jgi:hypothetical protein
MKVIERWYEKLFGYDWWNNLKNRLTIIDWLMLAIAIGLIIDWLVRGDV